MIQFSKVADERREAGSMECWLLHGAVGMAADWRSFAKCLAAEKTGSRAVDLWRFLGAQPLPLMDFGAALNTEAHTDGSANCGRVLLGYSMGGRLALHALLQENHPWQAAVIVSAHPGLEDEAEREARRACDMAWASKALGGNWQDFLTAWNSQSLLGSAIPRDPAASSNLATRRREIAQSFVDWSLGAQTPLWDRLHEITVPVLWVVGENDAKFLQLAERATSLMPCATLVVAPGAGHRVPWEAEHWLAAHVARFLREGIKEELNRR